MLGPWSKEQTTNFFSRAFAKVSVVVEEDAMLVLIKYTGGLPMLAHEIGDATFRANGDGVIDLDDSVDGVFKAAEIVGEKYVEPQVLSAIKSDKYKSILLKIVQKRIQSFSRADVAEMLNAKEEKVLGNFLGKMKKLGVLTTPDDAGKGTYRFATRLHYLYLQLYAQIQQNR